MALRAKAESCNVRGPFRSKPERAPLLASSIVSDSHGGMVKTLLAQLQEVGKVIPLEIVVNVSEDRCWHPDPDGIRVTWIENARPRSFVKNHNAAFARTTAPYFCGLNPDVEVSIGIGMSPRLRRLRLMTKGIMDGLKGRGGALVEPKRGNAAGK